MASTFLAPLALLPAAPAQAQEARLFSFSIPARPVPDALNEIGRVTGLSVVFTETVPRTVMGRPVSGSMSAQQALATMLGGTGYAFRFTAADTITIVPASVSGAADGAIQVPELLVEDTRPLGQVGALMRPYAGGQVATGGQLGLLGNRSVMDSPFSQTSYTAQTIQNQQARSVADVARNDPSVRSTWADGSYSNQFFVRGFPLANADIAINGLYGLVPVQMSGVSWVERVEVLRGPSALLSGMPPQGSIGGTINLVTKRAAEEPITRLTLGYVSNSQFGAQVDLSRRYGPNREWGVRFNGAYSGGDTPVSGQANRLGEVALGLDYRGERLRVSADVAYQRNESDNPARPIYARAGFQIPRAPRASANLGQDWYRSHSDDTFGILRAEYDVTDNITAYGSFGSRRNSFLGLYNFIYLKNAAGDFDANNYYQPSYTTSYTGEVGVRTRFNTGPVRHEVTLSAMRLWYETGNLAPVISTFSSNIFSPRSFPMPSLAGRASTAPRTGEATLTSVAIADNIYMLDDRLQLILGARHQNVRQTSWNATTGARTARYDESAWTPAVGLVVRPWRQVTFYANYIEGLSQGPAAPLGSANYGEVFAPIRSRQYEVGAKYDFGRVLATLALFQIEQPSGLLDTRSNRYSVGGETRNQGVELSLFGEVTRGLRVLGGVTFMRGEQTRTPGGLNDGKTAIGVPGTQLNIGAEWDTPFVPGLTLGGRVIHTSSQYASADNAQSIPGWTRVDLNARYRFERAGGQPVTLRAGIENVFGENYWAAASSNFGLARGAPRTFLLSATFDF
nr:TonB-dependent receptor [uncultured Roseococcus sp.]